jgi:hypothetical protein
MATVKATLLNQKADMTSLPPDVLALVHIASTVTDALVDRIALTASVQANWHMVFLSANYPLDSIKLEIGYVDTQGITNYKNSGTLIGEAHADLIPLIWTESTRQRAFQTAFLRGVSPDITIRYKLLFTMSPVLPVGFQDEFLATEQLEVAKLAQDFTIQVFLQ